MSDVDITMSADSRAVLRAMAAVEKSVTQIGNKVMDLSQKSDKLNKTFQNGAGNAEKMFGSVGTRLAGMVAGAFSVNSILSQMIQSGQDFSQKGLEASRSWDQVWREFAGQSELRGTALDEAEKRVRKIAQEVGMDLEQSVQAATQLVSSGFSAQEASGDSLREFLKGIVGSNVAGRKDIDPKLLAMSASSYLAAQGMDKTSKNLQEVMQRVQGLYKATNIQLQDFNDFARESASLKGILDIPTQLGAFATLRDVMSSEESSTGLRNVVQRMRTAGGDNAKTEGLAMLGLKPSDVDMVGEDFLQSLQKLSDGLKRVAPEKQDIALKKIFEERGLAIAKILIQSIQKVDDYVKKQIEQAKSYEKDVQFGGEGINAAERRQKAEAAAFHKNSGQDQQELYMTELQQYMREKKFSPAYIDSAVSAINGLRYVTGMSAKDSAKTVLGTMDLGNGEFGGDLTRQDLKTIDTRVYSKMHGDKRDNQTIYEASGAEPVRKTPARIEADRRAKLTPRQREEEDARKEFGNNWWVPGFQEKVRKQRAQEAKAPVLERPEQQSRGLSEPQAKSAQMTNEQREFLSKKLTDGIEYLAEVLKKNTQATEENTRKQSQDKPKEPDRRVSYRPTTRNLSGEMTS